MRDTRSRGIDGSPDSDQYRTESCWWRGRDPLLAGRRRFVVGLGFALGAGLASPALAQSATTRSFELTLRDGKLAESDNVIEVKIGDKVRLLWTTDAMTTVHLHGYDIEKSLSPDAPTTMSFDAFATGRFPVTSHGDGASHHEEALLYLEVRPR